MSNQTLSCPVCGSYNFKTLPSPSEFSMTTAGRFVPEPLSKEQCLQCSALRRRVDRFLGHTDFYEKHYTFFDRPGAAIFDQPRYAAMARWIVEGLAGYRPESIFDAGCGRGWMMRALREQFPQASFYGVEPSEQESDIARSEGWSVVTAKVDKDYPLDRRYDLVYCTNVVEHTNDPLEFLITLRKLTTPRGRIVVTCPDSSYPNAEFMFSDQNFSFTPSNLQRLAKSAGLQDLKWLPAPGVNSLHDKQLWVFGTEIENQNIRMYDFREMTPEVLFIEREEYVSSYARCDGYLEESVRPFDVVYNFGTSTWSMLLRAYCPAYWRRVTASLVDGGKGSFQDRPVRDLRSNQFTSGDAIVLGVSPYTQSDFAKRLQSTGVPLFGWSHIISR